METKSINNNLLDFLTTPRKCKECSTFMNIGYYIIGSEDSYCRIAPLDILLKEAKLGFCLKCPNCGYSETFENN